MKRSALREKVLKSVRTAQSKAGTMHLDVLDTNKALFEESKSSLAEMFAYEFNKVSGKFIYCKNTQDFVSQMNMLVKTYKWRNIFTTETKVNEIGNKLDFQLMTDLGDYTVAEVGITLCEGLVARTGSIVVSSGSDKSRTLSVFPPVHIVLAYRNQLFFDLKEALSFCKEKYNNQFPSMLSIITGPSRTADIEKTLVLGAHGPKDLFCFYINEYSAQ